MMTTDQMGQVPTEPAGGLDIGQVLKRRKLLLIIGLAAGAGLAYLYFIRQPPVYQSVARVMLTQKQIKDPVIGTGGGFVARDRLANEIILIRSEELLKTAMTTGELDKRPTFRSGPGALAQGLKVDEIESTDVLQLSFTGSRAEDCRAAVASVVSAYTDYVSEKKNKSHEEIKFIITEAITGLETELTAKETAYEEFQTRTQLLLSGGEVIDPHAEKISTFGGRLTSFELEENKINAEISTIMAARDDGGNQLALELLVGDLTQGRSQRLGLGVSPSQAAGVKIPQTLSMSQRLFQLSIQLASAREQYGPRHPKVIELEREERLVKQFLIQQEATTEVVETEVPEEKPVDLVAAYLNHLHLQLGTLKQEKEELKLMMAAESAKSREIRRDVVRNDNFQAEIARKRDAHREYVQRLKDIQLVQTYEGRSATVIAPASVASQVGPDFPKIITMGSVLGLMAGFGLACLIELADKSFRSPDDLMAELGIPVLSHIPFMRDAKKKKGAAAEGVGAALITVLRPKSRTAEAYRSVRTALYFSTSGEVNKIVQVTSPVAGDGKSTLAGNLAVAIAHSGKRVLLVDADLRRPTVHKVFGISNKNGVSTVVSGTCPLHEATHDTEVENLSILTCGPRPDNPSEMLLSPEFEQLLEYVRAAFDFVVIDSPPVLAVTDPASVAARADGVIVTLRLAKRSRDLAKRAVDQLQNVGANILGVVVNGVDSVESYGYQSYSYGGYGYGGYGQGYGGYYANQNKGYYDESSRQPTTAPKRQAAVPDQTNEKR